MDKQSVDRFVTPASSGIKAIVIGFLIVVLMVPLMMTTGLITERQQRSKDVVSEITSLWGKEQSVTGPIITIPFRQYFLDKDQKQQSRIRNIILLPEKLTASGELEPEIRYRGIYDVVVYNAKLDISGHFDLSRFAELRLSNGDILWDDARLYVGISDLRGLTQTINLRIEDVTHGLDPSVVKFQSLASSASDRIEINESTRVMNFDFPMEFRGSEALKFTPVGEVTTLKLKSSWPSPSFTGAFLPETRVVDETGFTAEWRALHLNRNYPQVWIDTATDLNEADMGVALDIPADVYQQATRTSKYAIMFLAFTFLAYFLCELLTKANVHPVQYLIVGVGIILYYVLLLALSEHIGFPMAYLVASVANTGLIASYSSAILHSKRLAGWVGFAIAVMYGFLYVLLQIDDYALLLGSIALFTGLAAFMYLTRNVDWSLSRH